MTYLTDHLQTENGHRLHRALSTLCITFASVGVALAVKAGMNVRNWPTTTSITVASVQFDLAIHMPMVGPVDSLLSGMEPELIKIMISPKDAGGEGLQGIPVDKVLMKVIIPFYVELYEDHIDWVYSKYTKNFRTWPSLLQFARVVRNAASHNKINWQDTTLSPVTWYRLTYSAANHGRFIFGTDLSFADMLILMFEISDFLDREGCPI